MNDIRSRFEEIWPAPDRIEWNAESGEYEPPRYMSESEYDHLCWRASEHNARLDTFTRCQETTDVYVSLVDEMVAELEHVALHAYGCVPLQTQNLIDRASQLKEQKK